MLRGQSAGGLARQGGGLRGPGWCGIFAPGTAWSLPPLEGLGDGPPPIDPGLAGDFQALGFCYFQVEVLTRQLRYMSNLDEARFHGHLGAALQSARQGDAAAAREHLRGAFDRLTEAREYFYPAETNLIDLTLVASTTIGESLRANWRAAGCSICSCRVEVLEEMASREPATLAALRQGLEAGEVTLIGGEYEELELPLLTPEDILGNLTRGLTCYERHLGRRPTIFGRRRFGLTPLLPAILRQTGFVGALHFTLDDGRFPVGTQGRFRWEGLDGTAIESLGRIPFEVARADRFLRLSERLGDSSEMDQGKAAIFAHWPGQSSPWCDDLWRMHQYGPVLGRFVGIQQYFDATAYSSHTERFEADKYRSPYLLQEVDASGADPVSRWVRRHKLREVAHRIRAVATMSETAGGKAPSCERPNPVAVPDGHSAADASGRRCRRDPLEFRIDWSADRRPRAQVEPAGCWPIRGTSLARGLDVSAWDELPEVAPPVVEAAEAAEHKQILVDVPAMGFAWVGPAPGDASTEPKDGGRRKAGIPRRRGRTTARRSPRATCSRTSTSKSPSARRPAASRPCTTTRSGPTGSASRSACGWPGPASPARAASRGGEEEYSVMAADEVSVVEAGPLVGRIQSRGRLMDREGQRLAGFVQTVEIRHGSRILELRIDLDIDRQPEPEPWRSYYAVRFAWTDETAALRRSVGLASQATEASFLESPLFLDLSAPAIADDDPLRRAAVPPAVWAPQDGHAPASSAARRRGRFA